MTKKIRELIDSFCEDYGHIDSIMIKIGAQKTYEIMREREQKALGFIKSSHHLDGCEHRYGKNCNCGKFLLEVELSETEVTSGQ